MSTEENKQQIRAFVARYFRNHDLRDDEDFFALGFVNSLFAMQLVMFIEKEFGIAVLDEDLDLDNFRSINALAVLIERKNVSPASS